jgi:predicted amidophosphoribosyltransferase
MQTQPVGLEQWVAAAGDLLLGASCHGCGQPWWGICPDCRRQLASRRPFFTAPIPCPDGFPVTVTSSTYDPILRRLISAHKERQALALTSFLADRLALSIHGLLAREPFIPVALPWYRSPQLRQRFVGGDSMPRPRWPDLRRVASAAGTR